MNKRDLKSLKDTLGKQGLTLDDLKGSSSSSVCDTGIVDLRSFTFEVNTNTEDGWYVGYGVEYNGVGISNGCPTSESEEEEAEQRVEDPASGESSGFSSDPPSEDEQNADSEGSGDDGQLLYSAGETIHFSQDLTPVSITLHNKEESRNFEKAEINGTKRFKVSAEQSREPTSSSSNGYQMINPAQDIADEPESSSKTLKTCSNGLSHNFIVTLKNAPKSEMIAPSKTSDSIPLDDEKISQISKAMTNFTLPTPPGWENVDDSKLLEFIKNRVSSQE